VAANDNNGGQVVQEEFILTFVEAMDSLAGPEVVMQRWHKWLQTQSTTLG